MLFRRAINLVRIARYHGEGRDGADPRADDARVGLAPLGPFSTLPQYDFDYWPKTQLIRSTPIPYSVSSKLP